jgi:putative ABC transport system permease protein
MKPLPTPKWADSLIDSLAPPQLAEEIRGDLYELFIHDVRESGLSTARTKYIFNALGFLLRSFFWKGSGTNSYNMTGSYFKMAWRSLVAYKGTAIINIIGLITGIAAALVIITVLQFELSFDTFHSDVDRIYRVVRVSGDDMSEFRTGISYPVPVAMKQELSSLESVASMEYFGGVHVDILNPAGTSIARYLEDNGCVVIEPSFFKILDFKEAGFKWIAGNPEKALEEPFNVVLTESLAKKYYPGGNALGNTLRFEKRFDCKVTGVIKDFPANTDFPFTILVSYSTMHALRGEGQLTNWFSVNDSHQTFIKIAPGYAKEEIEKQIAAVHAAHTPKELHDSRHYLLQELRDLHHEARFRNYNGRTISRETILALGLIAVFLLLTGSINYEIGLRKVMGGNRNHVVGQLLTETFLTVLTAGVIALIVSEVLLINLQSLLNLKLTHYHFADPFILVCLLGIILIVTLLSGLYPSQVISRFNPVTALKNKFGTETVGNVSLRKTLVVTQFTITQVLVAGTFIVVSQMNFFRSVDMGFNQEAVITVNFPDQPDPGKNQLIEDQLRSRGFASQVSISSTLPSGVRRYRSFMGIGREDAATMKDYQVFEYQMIDPFYLELYQIKLLAGRNLTYADSTAKAILINKTLVKNLQLGSPEKAIDKTLKIDNQPVTVVGVIDDFYSNSLKESVDNIVMEFKPRAANTLSVKINVTDGQESLSEAVKEIEKIWAVAYPEQIFNYDFFDENVKAFYAQEEKYAKLFQLFSLIFLLIGCLGLYGLITFVVNRKAKEVAIRKVLGATIPNILIMFSKEYVQLILLSFAIAVPVAWYLTDQWLSTFANHITLQWWLFLIPGFIVLCIAALVVCAKTLGAANMNPVDKLKYE